MLCAWALLLVTTRSAGQTVWPGPEVEQLYKQARELHSQGNLRAAIVRYQQAIQIAPEVVLLHRELAQAYYLAQGYDEAMQTLDPIIKKGDADAETYKIMAQCLVAINEGKKARKLLKEALEKMPGSGTLHHQAGLIYEQDGEMVYALESWLDGIKKDPSYHMNYYEAARTYLDAGKPIWTILYGEIFVNMEQYTQRSFDTRKMMIDAYTKYYSTVSTGTVPKYGSADSKNISFEDAVNTVLIRLSPVVSDGITTENLVMLRTRFIMDWTLQYAQQFPFALFGRHDMMIRDGYFDIYNQWLFGRVENRQQYEAWTKFHENAMGRMENWLRQHPYQPDERGFYNDKVTDELFKKQKETKR